MVNLARIPAQTVRLVSVIVFTVGWIRLMGIDAAVIRNGAVHANIRIAMSAVMIRRFTRKISFTAKSAASQYVTHVPKVNLPNVIHAAATSVMPAEKRMNVVQKLPKNQLRKKA